MGYQVIITTHHPVTASFVKDESLFLMYESSDGMVRIKNAKDCNIHPVDHLADQLFILSKPVTFVFVENEIRKIFLQQINRQLSVMALRDKTESSFLKLFRFSKFQAVCYQEKISVSSTESEDLKKFVRETFKQKIEDLKTEQQNKSIDELVKMLQKRLIAGLKYTKNSFNDPSHLDVINKYAKIIDYFLQNLEIIKTNDEFGKIMELIVKIIDEFGEELEIQEDEGKRKKQLRRNFIASVQDGNCLKSNNETLSIGYVEIESYFDKKEFLISELRQVENYLFDPLNIFEILKHLINKTSNIAHGENLN